MKRSDLEVGEVYAVSSYAPGRGLPPSPARIEVLEIRPKGTVVVGKILKGGLIDRYSATFYGPAIGLAGTKQSGGRYHGEPCRLEGPVETRHIRMTWADYTSRIRRDKQRSKERNEEIAKRAQECKDLARRIEGLGIEIDLRTSMGGGRYEVKREVLVELVALAEKGAGNDG